MDINLETDKKKALELLDKKLQEQITDEISGVHSKSHLTMTANLTQLVGKIYHYNDKELFLSYFSALFHDIVRSPSEDAQIQDEKLSAEAAFKLLGQFQLTDQEKAAVFFAIENHGKHPSWKTDSLKEKLHLGLFVADKIEQNGVRVIARRSAFVAGERLHKADGDLREFGFKPSQDELLVVAIESALRLTFINPQFIYPQKLTLLLKSLYKIQREFMFGLMKTLNLEVENLAQIILDTKREDGKNLKEVRSIGHIKNVTDLTAAIETAGQITNSQIYSTSNDSVKASIEAVEYFSKRYEKDIDKLMLSWKPQNKLAKTWQQGMVEYLNGNWYKSIENQI